MREDYLDINGHRTWYAVEGEGRPGTPLLVIHGGPGFMTMTDVVSDLAAMRPVYFYDQYGCGKSGRAPDSAAYTVEGYTRELAAVRRALKLDNVFLLGFSWGTALIGSYLLQEGTAGVKGIILSGPLLSTARWDADQREHISRMPEDVKKAIEHGEAAADYGEAYQEAMMAYYYRHVCRLQPWPETLQTAFGGLNTDVYNAMWGPSEFTCTGTLKDLDLVPDLHRITLPVLLTCGDNDEASVKTVKDFQLAFPDASMAVLPDASHLHHIEQPELYKLAAGRFLAAHDC